MYSIILRTLVLYLSGLSSILRAKVQNFIYNNLNMGEKIDVLINCMLAYYSLLKGY